jgi:predicted Zn-dependent protease
VVDSKVANNAQFETGLVNTAAHEVGHDALGHSDSSTDMMYSAGASDKQWLINPDLSFTAEQSETLQDKYNKSGEVESKPQR